MAWVLPVLGVITQAFAWNGASGHTGTDLANNLGDPVMSPCTGTVVACRIAPWNSGVYAREGFAAPIYRNDPGWEWLHDTYGSFIVIRDAETGDYALLAHTKTVVGVGSGIQAGAQVGVTDNTGYTSGPHLHFERRLAADPGQPVNPMELIVTAAPGPVELSSYEQQVRDRVAGWAELVQRCMDKSGIQIPVELVLGLMAIESEGVPDAQSPMNTDRYGNPIGRAQGLMQVMPFHFGNMVSLLANGEASYADGMYMRDPERNITTALSLLNTLLAQTGRPDHAAAAYFGAYNWSAHQITGWSDVTGTSGNQYVQKFLTWRDRFVGVGPVPQAPVIEVPDDTSAATPPPAAEAAIPPAEIMAVVAEQLAEDARHIIANGELITAAALQQDWPTIRQALRDAETAARNGGARLDAFAS